MRRTVTPPLLCTLTLLAAACSAGPAPPDDAATQTGPPPSRTRGAPAETPSDRPDESRAPNGNGAPRPGSTATRADTRYDDNGAVGEMARTYLRSSPARRLVVEIDYVRDREPTAAAIRHLEQILERECRKPGGVTVSVDDRLPEGNGSYSLQEIAALERRHRDRDSSGDTAVMWLVYLDGRMQEEQNALGVAYRASSAALFSDLMQSAATALVQPGAIERSVLTHEVGHLLALVNIGYRSDYAHEDPDHPKHSRYRESVMYWAVEDVSIASILSGGPPSDFDRYDRADLAKLRSG